MDVYLLTFWNLIYAYSGRHFELCGNYNINYEEAVLLMYYGRTD